MRDQASKAVRELMAPLTKGPWTAHGAVLYAGAKVIAACPGANGALAAKALADTLNAVDLSLAMTPEILLDALEQAHVREGELIEEVASLLEDIGRGDGQLQGGDRQAEVA